MTGFSASPRAIKWLRRIGYVTTPLVAAQIVLLVAVALSHAVWQARGDAVSREERRTHERPLTAGDAPFPERYARGKFEQMNSIAPLGPNGFRIFIEGAKTPTTAAVVMNAGVGGGPAHAAFGLFADDGNVTAPIKVTPFEIPADVYAATLSRIDRLTDGWPGDAPQGNDGALVGFERRRGARITSGVGLDRADSTHYSELETLILDLARTYAPGAQTAPTN